VRILLFDIGDTLVGFVGLLCTVVLLIDTRILQVRRLDNICRLLSLALLSHVLQVGVQSFFIVRCHGLNGVERLLLGP